MKDCESIGFPVGEYVLHFRPSVRMKKRKADEYLSIFLNYKGGIEMVIGNVSTQ
jgi:hypothetical protein